MKTVELFSGTKSFSKVMAENGHSTFTVDNDSFLDPDVAIDIGGIDIWPFGTGFDILWASPPCQGFSVASIGANWGGGRGAYIPKSERAKLGIQLVKKTIDIIEAVKPTWWFIENPRGVLRKMPFMEPFIRHTVTYCQYGDTRMKPTDIWTNATWWKPRPVCKNGDPCHERAPRGARTGTQGIDGAKDRGKIPPAIFQEILDQRPL